MAHQWIHNVPYRQSGTSVNNHSSGIAYLDSSTPTHEHSSTPDYSSFGLPFQLQTGFSIYQNASTYQNQLECSSSPSMSEPLTTRSSSDDKSKSGKEKKILLKEEVICLIESYRKKEDFKNPRMRNKDIWCDISYEMKAQGHATCDAKSCETKFKNLKRAYIACIDHNNKTGNDAKRCAYYEELHEMFHRDSNVIPPAVYSSRKGLVKGNNKTPECSTGSEVEDSEGTGIGHNDEEEIKKKKIRKKPPSERSELVSLFKKYVDRKEEKEEQKLQKLQEMHNEKMSFFGHILKLFEKSIQDK